LVNGFVHDVHCLKTPRTAAGFMAVFRDILSGKTDLASLARRGSEVNLADFHLDGVLPRIESVLEATAHQAKRVAGTAAERLPHGAPGRKADTQRLCRRRPD